MQPGANWSTCCSRGRPFTPPGSRPPPRAGAARPGLPSAGPPLGQGVGALTEAKKPRSKRKVETAPPTGKKPFDIEEVMRRLREATAPYPKAALFELYAEG